MKYIGPALAAIVVGILAFIGLKMFKTSGGASVGAPSGGGSGGGSNPATPAGASGNSTAKAGNASTGLLTPGVISSGLGLLGGLVSDIFGGNASPSTTYSTSPSDFLAVQSTLDAPFTALDAGVSNFDSTTSLTGGDLQALWNDTSASDGLSLFDANTQPASFGLGG